MNPYDIVRQFEQEIAEYTGAKYAVAVESGSAAIFLTLKYIPNKGPIKIPRFTYPSVASAVLHSGRELQFCDCPWTGEYQLKPLDVYDSALRFKKGMFHGYFHCLSFHSKKHLAIGRGGMILTNDKKAYEWLKKARFDGRDECDLNEQKNMTVLGYNMYMTPEQAARGLTLFRAIKDKDLPDLNFLDQGYPDLSKFDVFK